MSTKLRTHGKGVVVWILLGVIVVGLGGFGIRSFSGGMRTIGSVGGTDIPTGDYGRVLQSEMARYGQQTGKPMTMDMAKAIGLTQQVQNNLFTNAALTAQANRLGLSVGDAQVAKRVVEVPAFQGPGGTFDRDTYKTMLRQQGFTEAQFESRVRDDIARSMFRAVITGGASASAAELAAYAAFLTDRRPFAYAQITPADLKAQPAQPTDDQLQAYYKAHTDQFTAPASREITYAWITPELLGDAAKPDDAALKAAYQDNLSEYQQPERRMVDRLVYPSEDSAKAARAEFDAGKATFPDLAKARGLGLKDIDIGEVSEQDLGKAGAAVFAPKTPGIVGPIDTDLGPALFMVNGIEPAKTTTFDEAKPDLITAATLENGRKMIQAMRSDIADRLASGATLEDLAKDTKLQLGHIALTDTTRDGIAAYQAFRDEAGKVSASDFPEVGDLEDGGIFALRLDKDVPATAKPFDSVKADVTKAWTAQETTRLETERAKEIADAVSKGATLPSQGVLVTNIAASERSAQIGDLPAEVMTTVFATEPGKAGTVNAEGKTYVVVPGATVPADAKDPRLAQIHDKLGPQISGSLSQDLATYYSAAIQTELGATLDTNAINSVQAQLH